ncbi:unnamed protein product [Linum tenue]|uniref:Uncharacterized protein n=1 Tax=Linum tenue TaxID=586396 RepID=A0AAV0PFP8_9ROSI|nr:unnamed protein product [Linum tenue]
MAGEGGALSFSAASVVEDVLQQHGTRLGVVDLDSRRAEEAASRRYEAAGWLRKTIGVLAAKDLPAEPSEEEFRLGLRSGIILCNALNKVQTGAVPKVVESPCDAALIPEGAALSAFQYFENVRNFLVGVQEMGIPTFEASDLEQGGKSARVVNSVLALKSYSEWKQAGGNGVWKFGGNVKPTAPAKSFVRKNSEPFTNSLSRNMSAYEKHLNTLSADVDPSKMVTGSLSMLVRAVLSDKKPEEVPGLVESVLSKVVDAFENRISGHYDMTNKFSTHSAPLDKKAEAKSTRVYKKEESYEKCHVPTEEMRSKILKQQALFDQQQHDIQDLKQTLHIAKAGMHSMQREFHEEFNTLGVHIHGLAHAASGYHKVLQENRKLYNQVQDLKGSIRVYCRVRPFLSGQSNFLSSVDSLEEGTISINTSSKHGNSRKSFSFNKVYGPSATQAEVFSDMQPLIRSVLDGYNVCIFAYGQTGSGKTYTMTGPRDLTEQSKGVNYRALSDLFLLAEQRKDTFCYNVAVQMIEIYNEQVRDLLVSDGSNKRYPSLFDTLEIRNSSQTGLNVPDANLVPVASTSDVIYLMNLGHRNRAVGATALNDRSSRSHSCLTVHVQGKDLTSGKVLRGCMHLVDLAGSERVDKSEVRGDRLKEAQHINRSLSALGDVIASLAQKNPHVPYRNSKLTQLLQDSLGGQAKTLMFVHISPEPDAVGETISTLKFAERVATVELGAARVNKDSSDVKELKEQVASLKAALLKKEAREQTAYGSNDRHKRVKESEYSPFNSNQRLGNVDRESSNLRQPMGDVGNIEVRTNTLSRQTTQSFDQDELLTNSPPWPPIISHSQNCGEQEREIGSGEWVDKVMVNKQDAANRLDSSLGCWEAENGHFPEAMYQKYLSDPSKAYSQQSYNVFTGNSGFTTYNASSTDEMDDLDADTCDSSEPDLLWQFNQCKLGNMGSGMERKNKKTTSSTASRTPDLRQHNSSPMLGPSPSRKLPSGNGVPVHRKGRQTMTATDGKRKPGNRK